MFRCLSMMNCLGLLKHFEGLRTRMVSHVPRDACAQSSQWLLCYKTWHSTTVLGCPSWISVTMEMLSDSFLGSSLRAFSLVKFFLVRRTIWLHSWHLQPRNSPGADDCVRSKKQQTPTDMLIYRVSERKFSALWTEILLLQKKEASQLHSDLNCKHSWNFTCHAHERNATELGDQNVVEVT